MKKERLASLEAAFKIDLLAIFESWTVGDQYDFDGARQALNADLRAGNLARAIAGVQTFRPADTSIAAHRQAVLDVLTAAAPKFVALHAATTLEAVAAVA